MGEFIGLILKAVIGYGFSFFIVAICVLVAGGEGAVGSNIGSCAIAAAILYFAYQYEAIEAMKFQDKKNL